MPQFRMKRWLQPLWLASFVCGCLVAAEAEVKVTEQAGKVRVETDGRLFTEYVFQNTPRPYLYPILGPQALPMTRDWPMKETAGEERDHPHHKSLWFTHGDVNGVDFWTDGDGKGKIVHDKFLELAGGAKQGVIRSRNRWVGPDGKVVCTDERTVRFRPEGEAMLLDFEIVLRADHGEIKFGDTKEGTMGIRVAETMRLKGKIGKGHIVNSEGVKDGDTWGKRADWCDYYGPVRDTVVGVSMFDHPQNPRHPTWWHVRDYGLFAANPFGLHEFEKQPKNSGDLVVPDGQSLTFRYRFYFHLGDTQAADVAKHYQEYIKETP
jgi:hypothetical protein